MLGVWWRRQASSLIRRSLIFPVSWRLCFSHLIRILSMVAAGQAGVAESGVAAAVLEAEVAVGVAGQAAVVGVAEAQVEVGMAGQAEVAVGVAAEVEVGVAALAAAVEAAVEAGPVAALARLDMGGARTSPKIP